MFLDMTRLHGDCCNLKDRIGGHFNRFEFGRVEPHLEPFERTTQRTMRRVIACEPDPRTRTRALQMHEVPSGMTNHRVEYRGLDLFHQHPVVGAWLLDQIEMSLHLTL